MAKRGHQRHESRQTTMGTRMIHNIVVEDRYLHFTYAPSSTRRGWLQSFLRAVMDDSTPWRRQRRRDSSMRERAQWYSSKTTRTYRLFAAAQHRQHRLGVHEVLVQLDGDRRRQHGQRLDSATHIATQRTPSPSSPTVTYLFLQRCQLHDDNLYQLGRQVLRQQGVCASQDELVHLRKPGNHSHRQPRWVAAPTRGAPHTTGKP